MSSTPPWAPWCACGALDPVATGRRSTDAELNAARAALGFDDIRVDPDANTLTRTREDIELDLSAIAKGLAVDKVIETLLDAGVTDALVEVGGEVRTAGHRPGGEPWRLAVESPFPDDPSWVALVTLENLTGHQRRLPQLPRVGRRQHRLHPRSAHRPSGGFPHRQRFGAGPHLRRGRRLGHRPWRARATGLARIEARPELEARMVLHAAPAPEATVQSTQG
ncbi:MAG: FAD:protein FMN transferase [Planctomycetota bacterium]